MIKKVFLFSVFCLILGCKTQQISPSNQSKTNPSSSQNSTPKLFDESIAKKIIFVGNSQTYTNNVPLMVQEIGEFENNLLNITDFSKPDYSLEDHWNEGQVQAALDKTKYDFMVAQQGSSALPESQVLLKEYAKKFAEYCKKNEIKMNLYMVWPMKLRLFDLDNVIFSYSEAAKFTESSLSPVGLAWKKAWEKLPNLGLHASDGLHATKKGSILAAMTIYASLFKKKDLELIDFSKVSWKNDLTKEEFEIFKQIIAQIVKEMK